MKEVTQTDLLTLAAFIIQNTKTEDDNKAAENFKAAVANFDFTVPVADEQAVNSSFDLLHDLTAATKWPGDEKIVNTLEMTYRTALQVEQISQAGGQGWFNSLIERFRNRKNR